MKRRITTRTQDTVLQIHDGGVDPTTEKITAHMSDGEIQMRMSRCSAMPSIRTYCVTNEFWLAVTPRE